MNWFKDRTKKYLAIIFFAGLILRLIAAINLDVAADDMHFAPHAVNFLSSGKLVTYDQSASLWFITTSVFYDLMGNTQLASRLAGVIFGSLSILLIFLLTREFFSEQVSLITAFMLAFSPFLIKMMMAEMDIMAMFFVFFGMYFFIRGLKIDGRNFIWSGVFIGLGIITKLYSLFFIPCLLAYAVYFKHKNKKLGRKLAKDLFIFCFIAGLFFMPAIIHNYLLYKDKGFLDLQFTRVFDLGRNISEQYYGWDHQFTAKPDFKGLIFGDSKNLPGQGPTSMVALSFIYYPDPIIFFLGILGLVLIWKGNRNYLVFFLCCFILPFVYLASIILLPKHYVFVLVLLTPAAAYTLDLIASKVKIQKKHFFIILAILYIILLGFKIPNSMSHVYGESAIAQLMDYKERNIEENALVVADSRMYRGDITWAFSDRHYIEASLSDQIFNQQDKLPGNPESIPVYFIECVRDDCGWGNVKDQPDFNKTMEGMVEFFKNNSAQQASFNRVMNERFYFPFFKSGDGETYYRVYKTSAVLKPGSLVWADSSHSWFLYPLGYDEKIGEIFDKPKVEGVDNLIYGLARLIQYFSLVIAFISVIVIFKIVLKQEQLETNDEENINNNPSV